ncbi:Gfo/Idh/MocA family protein [Sphingomonas sp.]|uniref:Gfo/Idh/MocA family protein n=1 Tax=Sphingomonas sp. TaxID=28214 RepID=UPI0035C7DBD8
MTPIRTAIVGLGKIAHDQHIPAMASLDEFAFVAAASHRGHADGIAIFRTIDELLASDVAIDAVSMCQPPQARFDDAAKAIRAGKHVLLEKPPGATLSEVEALVRLSEAAGTTLFAAWHSRFAPGVAHARAWLTERRVYKVAIVWKEDVRRWHPGQTWIWEAGGLGVFDPGINAFSIATEVLPRHFFLRDGTLEIPSNCASPIKAQLNMVGMSGAPVTADLDFLQTGPQTWDITVETDAGTLVLSEGGAKLSIDGTPHHVGPEREYPALYERFAKLIANGQSDVDRAPLRLVADAFMRCRQVQVAPFIE